ncbi:alpha/beta hydrolase [Paraburkholderia solisilvae]|uniref:AB hydrolase-1 domain-containing protein n=1 Tax=Paraburkholderia solisilvae TaxID=624376 RepID=A0A6J5ECN9_9BURK|nr:alpha/beta hydrolase [Paraburkholderia solisilvae]CAB3764229.1 hypothetical protein LMG29739_04283 [Paraburkholderia solisilvae]
MSPCARFQPYRQLLNVPPESLALDRMTPDGRVGTLLLHGAAAWRSGFTPLRVSLAKRGFSSAAFDFSGHGESSNNSPGSLARRLVEAEAVLRWLPDPVHTVVGNSMSGEIAIRLAATLRDAKVHLVLLAAAIYHRNAFEVPFGQAFSDVIRQPESWRQSDALTAIESFTGSLTIVRATNDHVIPHSVADLIEHHARSACRKRIVDLTGQDHHVIAQSQRDAALCDRLADCIIMGRMPIC